MNITEIRRAILRRMADGRERTKDDIARHVKCDPDMLTSVLKSMALRKELRAGFVDAGRQTAAYRIYSKAVAERTP